MTVLSTPQMVVANFAYDAGGWRIDRHPRFMADVTGDGRADIVGFGNAGVWVSLNNGDGTFQAPQMVVGNFGLDAGGWDVNRHPRFMADVTGDGRADIVGFGNAGVWVSLNNGDGTFQAPQMVVANFAYDAGGWRIDRHPRFMADVTGDGRADIVGFGNAGVWVSLNNGDGTFQAPQMVVGNFGLDAGGWDVNRHPRFMADVTGDGRADIVGFGNAGVWVSLNNGGGTFQAPQMVVANFAYDAGGWRIDRHPRFMADVTGDGRADIVGFGNAGVWVSLNNGDGTFQAPQMVVGNFGLDAGGWDVNRHPRFMADVTGDGRADIVGFGNAGVWVSLNNGDGTFQAPQMVVANFAYDAGGWRIDRHPRFMADVTGDGRADIVGFGNAGVWVSKTAPFVRRSAWSLTGAALWDPIHEAYARGVRAMQARPITDPTSWTFQAAMHGSSAAAPPGALWNQCQHGSWFFLSWHRMYLYYFERILRAAVLAAGGPADFALPYWNYDQAFPNNTLPQPFRQATLPDGTPNPLRLGAGMRSSAIAAGGQVPASSASSANALARTNFHDPPAATFGGIRQAPAQFAGSPGALEMTPHNGLHTIIGGSPVAACGGGLMSQVNCAALDPIFWLHHANIDRLWTIWIGLGGGRSNPTDAAWRSQVFQFHDETGSVVQMTGAQVVDTARQLDYVYDDHPAARSSGATMQEDAAEPDETPETPPRQPPEMLAATEQPVELTGTPVSISITMPPATRDLVPDAGRAAPGTEVFLNVEDIEAEQNPGIVYGVYLVGRHVGNVALFGIELMNDPDSEHGGVPGFRHTFDVTAVVRELNEQGRWDPNDISVTFAPLVPEAPPDEADAQARFDAEHEAMGAATPVVIGRVSLFVG